MMDWDRLLSAQRLGHRGAEPVTPARSPFQKDWDRIVFSSAFRRLQDKTQVHSLSPSDYIRTRLTHSLEVSSVGRSLGAAAGQTIVQRHALRSGITADQIGHIVAAACLAHDIGNPPFGHFGEDTIRDWFEGPGAALTAPLTDRQRADLAGFEGNAQGFRIVARLQNWLDQGGLRLTCATLASFAKYPFDAVTGRAHRKFGFYDAEADLFREVAEETGLLPRPAPRGALAWCRHPLAWLVEAADDICYRVVDLEDGFKLGRIGFAEAEGLMRRLIGRDPPRYREIDGPSRRIAYLRAKAIGQLIDEAAQLFLDHESEILAGTLDGDLVTRLPARPVLDEIAVLTRTQIFETRERYETEVEGHRIITGLLSALTGVLAAREEGRALTPHEEAVLALIPELPPAAAGRYQWLLAVTDHVSGMTDSYAQSQFRRLRDLG